MTIKEQINQIEDTLSELSTAETGETRLINQLKEQVIVLEIALDNPQISPGNTYLMLDEETPVKPTEWVGYSEELRQMSDRPVEVLLSHGNVLLIRSKERNLCVQEILEGATFPIATSASEMLTIIKEHKLLGKYPEYADLIDNLELDFRVIVQG